MSVLLQIGDPDQFDLCVIVFAATVACVALWEVGSRVFGKRPPKGRPGGDT